MSSDIAPALELLGVRIGRRAVHHHDLVGDAEVVPEGLQQRAALHLADQLVVEGDVGVDRALGQPVVGDDRDARVLGLLHAGRDGVGVDRVQHDDVDLLVDHRLELARLLAGVRVGVGVLDPALVVGERLHLRLEDGVVELLVAGVCLLRQQQPDGDVVALGRARVVAAPRRVEHAAAGEHDGHGGGGHGYGDTAHARAHFRCVPDVGTALWPM
ncbi:hypothetical protein RKD26_003109 [Streptomyces calvus]